MNGEFDDLDLLDSSFKIHSSDGLKSIKLAEFPTSKPGIESPNTFLGPIASLSKINSGLNPAFKAIGSTVCKPIIPKAAISNSTFLNSIS